MFRSQQLLISPERTVPLGASTPAIFSLRRGLGRDNQPTPCVMGFSCERDSHSEHCLGPVQARQFFSGTPVMYFFSLRVANALITFSLNSAAGAPVIPVRWTVYNAQLLTGALLSGLPRFTLFFSFVLFCCSGAHRAPRAPPGGRVAVYSAPRGLVTRYSHLGSQGPKSPSYSGRVSRVASLKRKTSILLQSYAANRTI